MTSCQQSQCTLHVQVTSQKLATCKYHLALSYFYHLQKAILIPYLTYFKTHLCSNCFDTSSLTALIQKPPTSQCRLRQSKTSKLIGIIMNLEFKDKKNQCSLKTEHKKIDQPDANHSSQRLHSRFQHSSK